MRYELVVPVIVAEGCKRCELVQTWLREVGRDNDITIVFEPKDCISSEAVDLAIQYNLDDVPSFVIGGKGFSGIEFSLDSIVSAMKEALDL